MKYPSKTSYAWIGEIKTTSFSSLLLVLFLMYVFLNCIFADLYYFGSVLKDGSTLLDHFYFSFVTALTIGYGDFSPITSTGKFLVIIQSCIAAIYFAVMVSALSVKMFYPKDTLCFSQKLLFDTNAKRFAVRMVNTHKERLVNPEIRIFVTEHCFGNVSAPMHRVTKFDDMPYLGKHDFSLYFSDILETGPRQQLSISGEREKALIHDLEERKLPKSRFSITISVSGSYGIQQAAYYKKYYPSEVEVGTSFKPIEYNDEDQRKRGNIRYTKFKNFWNDFNRVV